MENKDDSVVSTQYAVITEHLLCAACYLAMISTKINTPITVPKTGKTCKRKGTWYNIEHARL